MSSSSAGPLPPRGPSAGPLPSRGRSRSPPPRRGLLRPIPPAGIEADHEAFSPEPPAPPAPTTSTLSTSSTIDVEYELDVLADEVDAQLKLVHSRLAKMADKVQNVESRIASAMEQIETHDKKIGNVLSQLSSFWTQVSCPPTRWFVAGLCEGKPVVKPTGRSLATGLLVSPRACLPKARQ